VSLKLHQTAVPRSGKGAGNYDDGESENESSGSNHDMKNFSREAKLNEMKGVPVEKTDL